MGKSSTHEALELDAPTKVEAEASDFHEETAPKTSKITYHFPARGKRGPGTRC